MPISTGSGTDGGAADEWQLLRQAWSRWRQAEARLYPVAMVDPDWYAHAVRLVSALAAELRRRCTTPAELLAAEAEPTELLAALPTDDPIGPPLDPRLLVEVACSLRGGELLAAAERRRRAEAVAAARASGAGWAVLEGSPPTAESAGARCVAMHLRSGRALVATVDVFSGGEPFGLEEVALDPDTGAPAGRSASLRQRSFVERSAWLAEWHRWREEIGDP